ncbi:hypothetical protein ACIRVF_31930 [Kitasatospora sp. NPDC101157]|uniref:hypothetical protein n=1 Tax=Kitasatospora sp. NPDC101157 TaxID=3364098 RepID=UPI00380B1212
MNSRGPTPAVPAPGPEPVALLGPVVVGVGRSAASHGAVTWAADEAARTGRALRLVAVLE